MRILHLGGSGLIGAACVAQDVADGHDVWILNRGVTHNVPLPAEVRRLHADVRDGEAVAEATAGLQFDAVVQWLAFEPEHVRADIAQFADAGQYVFISSASAYEKPPSHYLISEDRTPTLNPFWSYSRGKIACEQELWLANAEREFPMTIVRPSLTYGLPQIPVCIGSWEKPFTIVARMRRGAPILVPGDGTSLWVLMHNTDFARAFAGLLGNARAIGEAVHITSEEVLTWNRIYADVARAAGVEANILHVPTDAMIAADPDNSGSLWGDKVHSVVFDNSKLRGLIGDFQARVPFAQGIFDTIAWFDADPARQAIDEQADALWDRGGGGVPARAGGGGGRRLTAATAPRGARASGTSRRPYAPSWPWPALNSKRRCRSTAACPGRTGPRSTASRRPS